MQIRQKLYLTIMGLSVAAVVITVAGITTYSIYDMRKSAQQELNVAAALTGDRNSAALLFIDSERAYKNMEVFRLNDAMLMACIYDAQTTLFAAYTKEGSSLGSCPAMQAGLASVPKDGVFHTQHPVLQNGQNLGTVFLASDTTRISENVHKILLISGTAASLVLLLTALLAARLEHSISGPILRLARTAQAITEQQDYSLRAPDDASDETGVLARAFNAMLNEVHARDEALSRANTTLEEKVERRTHQLEEAKERAEMANAAKTEFLRNMSHEFRTPLHALMSFSAYGIKEYESSTREQLKQYFELMQKGAGRLAKLVDEVLDLARLEHGSIRLALREYNAEDLAERAAELVRPLAMDKGLILHIERTHAPVQVACDSDRIMQVLTNLLGNAIKFTPSGGRICIRAEHAQSDQGPQVLFSVADEGVGIPEQETKLIFESFRQSSRTNSGAGGTGLGLAICARIVEAHGGRIWAENNQNGRGACVSFLLPQLSTGTIVKSDMPASIATTSSHPTEVSHASRT